MGRLGGNRVAIKMLRLGPEDDKDKIAAVSRKTRDQPQVLTLHDGDQRFCKEVLLWPRLHHPNVLPIYGVSMTAFPFCVVSPWMENGNILDYTRKYPEVNRMSLVSLTPAPREDQSLTPPLSWLT